MRKGQTLRVTATRVLRNVLRVFWNARAKYCTRHHSSRTCRQVVKLALQSLKVRVHKETVIYAHVLVDNMCGSH